MSNKKILYGVCGIGSGHTHRQLPLISDLAEQHQIIIFAYGTSLTYYRNYFTTHPNISICEVSVPFYVGTKDGIDFEATKQLPANQRNHEAVNTRAKAYVVDAFGKPDLVISDYEPISAEVAYEQDSPLVTIDQQSKYLWGNFPEMLNGCGYKDETERLQLFFPRANTRIACSFFNVEPKVGGLDVVMLPPILKQPILSIVNNGSISKDILVYLSAQQDFRQPYEEIGSVCEEFPDFTFHVFSPHLPTEQYIRNVIPYKHGDSRFLDLLASCGGLITTAGHTLLSEAMYLQIPVYALPLDLYEQQMNAKIIMDGGFGVTSNHVNAATLDTFLYKLDSYRKNIMSDTIHLLKGDSKSRIIEYINQHYLTNT